MSQLAKATSDRRCCHGVANVLLMLGLGLRVNLGFSLTVTTVGTAIHPVLIFVSIDITIL